jgi:hypothetical protein
MFVTVPPLSCECLAELETGLHTSAGISTNVAALAR